MAENGPATAVLFTEQDMEEGVEIPVGRGSSFLYSRRCPGKEAPNEDAACVVRLDGGRGVLVVADGVGGRPGGASASDLVVRAIAKHLESPPADRDSVRASLLDALEGANKKIMELGTGAGTTAAIVELDGDRLRVYHVGDSAVLAVGQRGKIKLQTVAHSPTGYAIESGMLDEGDALHHEERHLISNMVGDTSMRIEIGSWQRVAPRDTVVLATDGLFDNVAVREVADMVRVGPLKSVCGKISKLCAERMNQPKEGEPSKPDDLTFIVFRLVMPRELPRGGDPQS